MKSEIDALFVGICSKEGKERLKALNQLLKITENKVEWFEEKYDELVEKLNNENSYQRSIGIMLLCNLAKSDKNDKILSILPEIISHTRDEKFITARQCIQNIWKIAITNPQSGMEIMNHLKEQYMSCKNDKHYNLIRQDIIQSLYTIYCHNINEDLKADILNLIEREEDEKYKKKYLQIVK